MPQCVVFGCSKMGGHRFPRDESLRRQWAVATKRKNFVPTSGSRICSNHFTPADYRQESLETGEPLKLKTLKSGAVPSVFPWKKNLASVLSVARKERLQKRGAIAEQKSQVDRDQFAEQDIHDTFLPQVEPIIQDSECIVVDCVNYDVPEVSCEMEIQSENVNRTETCSEPTQQRDAFRATCAAYEGKSKSVRAVCVESVGTQTIYRFTFSVQYLKSKPRSLSYYTGLESFEKFQLVLNSLGPAAFELTYRYNEVENIHVEDQLLMTLMKLRRGTPDLGLSFLFDVSRKTVQNIVITWLRLMSLEWSNLNVWPSKELIQYYMPHGFKKRYPSTRVIVDGTEIPIAAPTNPQHQQATFSTYKNRTTLKALVGITPGGLVSYCSPAYAGSVSDRAIVERSDLVEKCDPNDSVMADRRFTVQDLFAPKNVTINMPSFLKGKAQLPFKTVMKDRKLANKRVHVERLIGLAKTYKILKCELPAHYIPLGSEIFAICCMLCNFRECIVGLEA